MLKNRKSPLSFSHAPLVFSAIKRRASSTSDWFDRKLIAHDDGFKKSGGKTFFITSHPMHQRLLLSNFLNRVSIKSADILKFKCLFFNTAMCRWRLSTYQSPTTQLFFPLRSLSQWVVIKRHDTNIKKSVQVTRCWHLIGSNLRWKFNFCRLSAIHRAQSLI
jgi:hypothetical protein